MDTGISQLSLESLKAGMSGLLLIADNYDALAARVLAARSAVHSLDLMYYLWHDDHTGRLLMQEVVSAAERGVHVRILLDDVNFRKNDAVYLALDSHPNIGLKLFNPTGMRNGSVLRPVEFVWRRFALTRRMHNKAWIADDSTAIVGGRNIGDAYFDAAETNFRDLDLLLLGPAVLETRQIFNAFWDCEYAKPIHALSPGICGEQAKFQYAVVETDSKLQVSIGGLTSIAEFIASSSDVYWTGSARVISDPPQKVGVTQRNRWLMKKLLPIIESARSHLDIVSPYFIPGRRGASILAELVKRGADVSVLTNSLAATDVAAAHGAYANYRTELLENGVQLFELQPFDRQHNMSVFGSKGASLHTKAFTVDHRIGFVGSFNFDPRSVSLNTEMGVLFEDEGLVSELHRRIQQEKLPETSYRLSLRAKRPFWNGLVDGEVREFTREPDASLYRRAVASLVRHLPIESQL